jgi:hypothetical protein
VATDFFAVLNEPRRAHLDDERLKVKFLELSSAVHPDRAHRLGTAERKAAHDRYVTLNGAYQCLSNTRSRVRHLLELERGAAPREIQSPPAAVMDLFPKVAHACRQADTLLKERPARESPLLQVQFFEKSQALAQQLTDLEKTICGLRGGVDVGLEEFDLKWDRVEPDTAARSLLLDRLEEAYVLLSYFDKWIVQLRERSLQLSLS